MQKTCALILSISLTVVALGQRTKSLTYTGSVIDLNDRPVASAEVICYEVFYDYQRGQRRWEVVGQARTDEQGRFSTDLKMTERKSIWVVAYKHGYSLGWDLASRSSMESDITIRLDEPTKLAGVVVDEAGEGISGAKVRVCLKKENINSRIEFRVPEDWYTTRTDAQGKFSFNNIPSDATADFWVEAPGKVCCWTFWKTGGYVGEQFEAGRNDIQIVLTTEAKILGQVIDENTGNPVEGIQLLARPDERWANYYCAETVISDSNGKFCFKGMPAETYSLQIVSVGNKMADWAGKDVKVSVEAGQAVSDVKVPVSKGAILELSLRDDQTNELIEGVSVRISQEANYGGHSCYWKSVETDETGTVRFRVPTGECHVFAGGDKYAYSSSDGYFKNREPIAVEKGKITRQDIQLKRNPHISGIVRDQNGQPVAGVVVASKPVCNRTVRTGADGRFEVYWYSRSSIRKTFLLARDEQHNLASLVEFRNKSEPVDIKLEPAFMLEGKITDPNSKPINNASVKLRASLPGWITNVDEDVLTDVNGIYKIKAIPAPQPDFTYSIEIESNDHGPEESGKISFHDDPTKPVQIDSMVLKPADQSISGIVVDSEGKPAAGIQIFVYGPRGSWAAGQPNRRAVTNEHGKFFIKRVCKGPLKIRADHSSDPEGAGYLDAHGGDKDVKVVLGQDGAHVPYVSLEGKQLPELKDFGIKLSPVDIEGKRILVCFFDMEQRPSRHCMIQLTKQARELKEKDVVAIAVQTSKVDENKLNEWVKKNNVPFPVGMVEGDDEKIRFAWGVKSLPWLILTDQKHIVCAEGFSLGELDDKLKPLGDKK